MCQGKSKIMKLCKGGYDNPINGFLFKTCYYKFPTSVTPEHSPSMHGAVLIQKERELETIQFTFFDNIYVVWWIKDKVFRYVHDVCKYPKLLLNSVRSQAYGRNFSQPLHYPGGWYGLFIHKDAPFPMKSIAGKKCDKFQKGRPGKCGWGVQVHKNRNSKSNIWTRLEVYDSGRSSLTAFRVSYFWGWAKSKVKRKDWDCLHGTKTFTWSLRLMCCLTARFELKSFALSHQIILLS